MSRDAVAVATLLGSLLMLNVMAGPVGEQAERIFELCFSHMGSMGSVLGGELSELMLQCIVSFLLTAGPFLAVTAVLAIAATFFQTKLLFATESLKPQFSRLNPLQGFKRLFSLHSVIEAVKSILKISILLYLIYSYFTEVVLSFSRFLDMDLDQACNILVDDVVTLITRISIAFVAVAFLDYLYQWWDYERNLKMSKQEVKEEYKQTEGDPQVKGRIKEIQRRRARERMMQQVPQADVVIRNPTHVAVALRYDAERDNAPVVLAKGVDELALRIVKVAQAHNIATVENVPLARSLYETTDLDREIPPELYAAVAEVLVYVLRLDKKLPPAQ